MKNKILIIGSNSGLIQESINRFLNNNQIVIGVSKNKANFIKKKNKNYHHYKFNLIKNYKKIESLCKKISKTHGKIDVIIFAQGGSLGKNKILEKIDNWEKVWRLNFGVSIQINNFFLKKFVKNNFGRVLFFSSVATDSKIGSAVYSTAKSAINDYVKKMGNNYSNKNVYLNSITTSIVSDFGNNWSKFEKKNKINLKSFLKKNLSTMRFGRSSDFVKIVEFLCSGENKFTTGSNFIMDGGYIK
jgi:3-oxoacyl-[acyl-carrier protein] reductase